MEQATSEITPSAGEQAPEHAVPGSYAWRRYFARMFDLNIVAGLLLGVLIVISGVVAIVANKQAGLAYLGWLQSDSFLSRVALIVASVVLWLPSEAFLLRIFGATPGKWIFGLNVRMQAGDLPDYWTGLSRATLVLVKGLGLTIPLVSLCTLIVSYDHLVKKGTMSWDDDKKTVVNYAELTSFHLVLCVLAVIVWAIVSLRTSWHYFGP